MAKGPKKHLKRLNAPRHWMLSKMTGIWAPRPSTGPHKLRESLPLSLILRNRLKYSLTRRETIMVVMRRLVKVDGKARTDINYPAGFMDVVTIDKTNENFRLLYDTKGRFAMVRLDEKEAKFKLLRVTKVARGSKASIGRNATHPGQAGTIPYIVTHDGRTIRYPDPHVKVHDTVKFNLETGKIEGHLKFDLGTLVMVTKGANAGRVGILVGKEKHPGSFDIVHIKDKRNVTFATRSQNVFVIGENLKHSWVKLPRGDGVKLTVLEEKLQGKK